MTDSYPYYCDLIARAAKIGVRYCVIHPSREPIEDSERAQRMENAKKSLALLCEYASAVGVVLAVEDLPRTCLGRNSAEILELISAHPNLRVCFDTNHLLAQDPVDFVRAVGEKIVTLHVSDYDGIDERHWLPGEGKIDWMRMLAAFEKIGYDGVFNYELGNDPADVKENYEKLFAEYHATKQ
jgi:sugar phosphate isomerase/epimerase